ncbi:MAG: idnO [Phenylobacterium sp.]|nr:idnO [Phenylobacterium sp.]
MEVDVRPKRRLKRAMSQAPARPTQPFSLAGRTAVVTGASRGLGFEMAMALARAGARVFVNGSHAGRAEAASARIVEEGFQAEPLVFDVTDEAAARAALSHAAAASGRLDILVNNVGMRLRQPLEAIDAAGLREMLDVDLVAPFLLSKHAAELMKASGYGRIIMISSVQGMFGRRGDAAYITAKGGMIAMARALAAEYGFFGVTCNTIAPGSFATETNADIVATPEGQALVKRRSFLRRYGEPHEIAGAAVFLASEAASYVTGALIPVDGGWSAAF